MPSFHALFVLLLGVLFVPMLLTCQAPVDAGRTAAARPESTFLAPTLRATMKQPSRDGKKNVDTRPLYKVQYVFIDHS